jgi:biotin operon repressor
VKEEDLDWRVYHLLVHDPCQSPEALAAKAGCSSAEVIQSLNRLEESGLIEEGSGGCRVLSVQEMLLRCQARYDQSSPFIIEGGVIRVKKGSE